MEVAGLAGVAGLAAGAGLLGAGAEGFFCANANDEKAKRRVKERRSPRSKFLHVSHPLIIASK